MGLEPLSIRAPIVAKPFKKLQQEAAKKTVASQRALPKAPTPNIPRLPNPTPAQTHAALTLAARSQAKAVGPNASVQKVRQYQSELAKDPRQASYLETIAHYTQAAQAHLQQAMGRHAGGNALSDQQAQALGAHIQAASALQQHQATPGTPQHSEGLLGGALRAVGHAGGDLGGALGAVVSAVGRTSYGFGDKRVTPEQGEALVRSGHRADVVAPGSLAAGAVPRSLVQNTGSDLLELGESPYVGGVALGRAVGQSLSGGGFSRFGALGSGLLKGVEGSAVGQLAQGKLTGALRATQQHPLFSALETLGGEATAGHALGAGLRAAGSTAEDAGLRGALARAGSTVRAPVGLTEDAGAAARGAVKERTYSKDVIRKAVQVAADKRRAVVHDAEGNPVTVTQRGRQVPVLAPSERQAERLQRKRADFESSRANSVEKGAKAEASTAAHGAERTGRLPIHGIRGQTAQDLTHLVATGTLRTPETFQADLFKRAANIENALKEPGKYRTEGTDALPGEFKRAQAEAQRLRSAAGDPKVLRQIPRITETGLRYASELNAADARDAALHIHAAPELERARLSEYALAHMAAQHFTVDAHRELEGAAFARERALVREGAPASEVQAARRARIAVSGRDAETMVAHEEARGASRAALAKARSAGAAVERAERARSRVVGGRGGPEPLALADGRVARLKGIAAETNAEHARLAKAAAAAKRPPIRAALRNADGSFLSNEDIRAHAVAAGRAPETLAHVPHVVNPGNARSYHKQFRPGSRPVSADQRRTGSLFQRGATAVSHDLVREHMVDKATAAAKVEALDKFAGENGLRHPAVQKALRDQQLTRQERKVVDGGGYFTGNEGLELSKRLEAEGKGSYVPIRAFAAKLTRDAKESVAARQGSTAMETAHLGLFNDRVVDPANTSRARNVVLVPGHQFNQILKHLQPRSELEKFAQLLNAPFRMAVLPQPRWLTGNFLEPYVVRMAFSGTGLLNIPGLAVDIHARNKLIKTMQASSDPAMRQAAKEITHTQEGGLFVGRQTASVHRSFQDFSGNTRRSLYVAHVVRNLPAVKQLGDMALALPKAFFRVNRVIETVAQRAALGHQVRQDVQAFTGSWAKSVALSRKAMDDVAKGLVNTSAQQRFVEAQHEMLGKYDGFSPGMRRLVQTVAPFLPWTLNSLRFVFWTLPTSHSAALTGLLKLSQAVQREWEAEHVDIPPGTLRDALRRPDGGLVDVARYTPYGATIPLAQGQLEGLPETLLPQLSGSIKALQGKNPFGQELQVPKTASNPTGKATGVQKGEIAFNQLVESLVPLVSTARRLQEGGATAYGNSTVLSPQTKPGTSHGSALDRTFDPFRATYLKAPRTGSGAGVASSPLRERRIEAATAAQEANSGSPLRQRRVEAALERAEQRAAAK